MRAEDKRRPKHKAKSNLRWILKVDNTSKAVGPGPSTGSDNALCQST